MRLNLILATMAVVASIRVNQEKEKDPADVRKKLEQIRKSPFASRKTNKLALKNGVFKRKQPKPFRYTEKKPKLTIKQVVRPNYKVHPQYVIPQPQIVVSPQVVGYHPHPYQPYTAPYAGKPYNTTPIAYPYYQPQATAGKFPSGYTHPYSPYHPKYHPNVKHVKAQPGQVPYVPVVAHHPHHPGQPVVVGHAAVPPCPNQKAFHSNKYWKNIKDAHVRSRYAYARDKCNRSDLTLHQKYQCFRINWIQYKPHQNNDLNAVRARVLKECGSLFADNLIKRKNCFDKHIRNYEHRLLADLATDLYEDELTIENEKETEEPISAVSEQNENNDQDNEDSKNMAQMTHVTEMDIDGEDGDDEADSNEEAHDDDEEQDHKPSK